MNVRSFYPFVCLGALLISPVQGEEAHALEEHRGLGRTYARDSVLTLTDAIQKTIHASPRIQAVDSGVSAAESRLTQASYWKNPEVGFEVENILGSGPFNGTKSAEYTVGLSQEIELGGKRSARKGLASAEVKLAAVEGDIERLDVIRDVYVAYAEVLASAEALKVSVEQETLAKDMLKTVSKRVDAAAEPEIQRDKARLAYASSVMAKESAERRLLISEQSLANLWGESQLEASPEHGYFFEFKPPNELKTYLGMLATGPEMQKQQGMLEIRKQQVRRQKTLAVPNMSAGVGVRVFNEGTDRAMVFELSLPLPLFDRNQGSISSARLELSREESLGQMKALGLERLLTRHWNEWNIAYSEAVRLRDEGIPAARRAFDSSREGYERGKYPYIDVLDAQRSLSDAWSSFYDALKRYHLHRANVLRLTNALDDIYVGEKG